MLAAMLVYKHAHGVVLKANAELGLDTMPLEVDPYGLLDSGCMSCSTPWPEVSAFVIHDLSCITHLSWLSES